MENLLDLIFSNIGILVVALAFVYSFIKGMVRQGSDPSKQQKPRPGMPSFGGQQPNTPQKRQRMERPSPQKVKIQTDSPRQTKQKTSETVSTKPGLEARIHTAPRTMQAASSFGNPTNKSQPARSAATARPDPVQGMMWAEVFAPPRAKRPYGRNRI